MDISKYAKNETQAAVLNHLVTYAPYEIDNRIKLGNFAKSNYKAREVREGLMALEKARLMRLSNPSTATQLPIIPDLGKSPRLHFLDVGLINYQLNLQAELLNIDDLHQSSKGKLLQQLVQQEIQSNFILPQNKLTFWVREGKNTNSEVDILYPFKNKVIPIEVKSGKTGTLRSLHEFMDRCDHNFAVRFHKGPVAIDTVTTRLKKEYKLLNLPYFLGVKIDQYLEWFMENKP